MESTPKSRQACYLHPPHRPYQEPASGCLQNLTNSPNDGVDIDSASHFMIIIITSPLFFFIDRFLTYPWTLFLTLHVCVLMASKMGAKINKYFAISGLFG